MNTDQTFGIVLITENTATAEVEALTARVAELEERMDFAERLLAREREPERLPPGGR